MRKLLPTRRGHLAACAVATVAMIGVAGCDVQENADLERGRALFTEQCGTCHALAEAGTAATQGPDLDASFRAARAAGMDQDTIEGVVADQIENPRFVEESADSYGQVYMPADLVKGQDLEDVSAYVASVAGIPGIEPPPLGSPEEVFTEKCAGCHTLSAANSAGTTGPNLDESLPGMSAGEVANAIRDPAQKIAPGFENLMPPFDEGQIPDENLQALVDYLLDSVGGSAGGGN